MYCHGNRQLKTPCTKQGSPAGDDEETNAAKVVNIVLGGRPLMFELKPRLEDSGGHRPLQACGGDREASTST
ncbi:hypothetical protein E4U61_004959 [Claviceps capensis]|nr:hypothetical protein E4U61_004959 [Claviceps capensis]